MANQYESPNNKKQNISSSQSIFPPDSNSPPESTSSALPPPYAHPAQSPPPSGMPYPQYHQPMTPGMGYAQPYVPPPGGQPYYPQQQQQQQLVVMNNQPTGLSPVFVVPSSSVSMVGAIALSCIAFWCFGWVFGGIAFILAMVGQSSAAAGDTRSAIHMRNASYGLSIAGIVSGIIIIAVVSALYSSAAYRYSRYNKCYNYYTNDYYYCK